MHSYNTYLICNCVRTRPSLKRNVITYACTPSLVPFVFHDGISLCVCRNECMCVLCVCVCVWICNARQIPGAIIFRIFSVYSISFPSTACMCMYMFMLSNVSTCVCVCVFCMTHACTVVCLHWSLYNPDTRLVSASACALSRTNR